MTDTPPATPTPGNEAARLKMLRDYAVLDTPAKGPLDLLCRFASAALDAPIALVSLVDKNRQWFKAKVGLAAPETPRNVAFCAHAIMGSEPFVVEDALADPRFADNPLVTGETGVRFYAGMPLEVEEGIRLGTVCVIDRRARLFTAEDREQLRHLGDLVVAELKRAVLEKKLAKQLARSRRNAQLAKLHATRATYAGKLAELGWWELDILRGKLHWSAEVRRIHEIGPGARLSVDRAIAYYAPEVRPLVHLAVEKAVKEKVSFKFELPIITAKGNPRWVRVVGEPVARDGRVVLLNGAIQDITEQKEATEKVEYLALHDSMTGLSNRGHFNDALSGALAEHRQRGLGLALILIDVDHFKAINDTLGHDAGDAAIIEIARRLEGVVRGEDMVARLGGDEYAVLAPSVSDPMALGAMLERVRGVTAAPWVHEGVGRPLGLSIGGALFPAHAGDAETLYKAADLALYDAKRLGRGRAAIYRPDPGALAA